MGIKINNFYKNISIAQNQRFLETFLIFISKQTIYLSIPTYIFPYSKSKYFFEFSIHSCRLKIRHNIFTKKMCIVVYTQQKQYKKDDQQIIGTSYPSHIPRFFWQAISKKIWVYHTVLSYTPLRRYLYIPILFLGIFT